MKLSKQILESIQRGINLAIDDFDDVDIEAQKVGQIKNSYNTRDLIRDMYFVDLGLPSGILWGKYNIGVDINKLNKASDWFGGYYAWGEIEEKTIYDWDTYKYANGNNKFKLIKYCDSVVFCDNGKPDNLTTLQDEDDVAVQTNKLPWNVKMPTKEQFDELLEYTTNEYVENYQGITGLNGRTFTSIQNGNVLFIPAAGYRAGSRVYDVGQDCNLLSSSLDQADPHNAHYLYFYSSECNMCVFERCDGYNVRPVLIK